MNKGLFDNLSFLYGASSAGQLIQEIDEILDRYRSIIQEKPKSSDKTNELPVSEKDVVLITYGDMVQKSDQPHLETLSIFLNEFAAGTINTLHILPFFPYSSDDGFSIIDFQQVDPRLGTWEDIERLGSRFNLMFDAVINHASVESAWFKGYLGNKREYSDFFIAVDEGADLSAVFRPRALPLTTSFQSASERKRIWTTFSPDQADLNYGNPHVLLRIIEILLFYVSKGAKLLRLDAIAYLWKQPGTSSIHLPQTHAIIQILRSILDLITPEVLLITETNVPHQENISYFGEGFGEAQMVYNFSLPPLVLQAFHSGHSAALSNWASELNTPSDRTTWFNFLASHDGIGLMPLVGILDSSEIVLLANRVEAMGGLVSYRSNPDGSVSPYELNVNFLDALSDVADSDGDRELISKRFLSSQAIMLCLKGVPGIYFHSLFGSRGWKEGVKISGRSRSVNRQKLNLPTLHLELNDENSLRRVVYLGYLKLLQARTKCAAFHPLADQTILDISHFIFACLRRSRDEKNHVLGLHNVSGKNVSVQIPRSSLPDEMPGYGTELIQDRSIPLKSLSDGSLVIHPYEVYWIGWTTD